MPFSVFGPVLHPDLALKALRSTLSVTTCPLPLPQIKQGANDLFFSPTPSSGDKVITLNGKGRPEGGRLRYFARHYKSIDPWLSQQLEQGYDFMRPGSVIAPSFFINHESTVKHHDWGTSELAELYHSNCVGMYGEYMVNKYGPPRIVAQIIIEESSGKLRFLWNGKPVNYIDREGHVEYEKFSDILPFIEQGSLCFKTDMRSGYYQVPMRERDAPYLCFIWDGIIYYWKVMPFGLHSAPKFFTRCTQPLRTHLRLVDALRILRQ